MATQAGTLELLARELARALRPLEDRIKDDKAQAFFAELGLRLPPSLGGQGEVTTAIAGVVNSAGGLVPVITQLTNAIDGDDGQWIISTGLALIGKLGDLLTAFDQLGVKLDAAASGAAGLT